MIEGVDYSGARPGGAALVAAGKRFAVRYVPYGGYPKGLTAAELADLRAHGLAIALVFESLAQRPIDPRSVVNDFDYARAASLTVPNRMNPTFAGRADAWQAQRQIMALGLDPAMAVYFACDWDVQPAQLPAIADYFRAAASILGGVARVGAYGGRRVIEYLRANRLASYLWQTYAWSGGVWVPGVQLQQYRNAVKVGGVTVDLNRALVADYGQVPRPSEADVKITTTLYPARRRFMVAAGSTVDGYVDENATRPTKSATWKSASSAWAIGLRVIERTDAGIHGTFHLVDPSAAFGGYYAGMLIPASQVTLAAAPDPLEPARTALRNAAATLTATASKL